ncbi:YadA-like family protein [Stenotrophomonas maltophilia]|nr:YadA-like family protein [Stenotrophomonas maltophilia]
MNHIYRRIWSNAKQCWVVVGELVAARGKPRSTLIHRRGTALIVFIALAGAAGSANAGLDVGCSGDNGNIRHCIPFMGVWDPRMSTGYADMSLDVTNSMAIGAGSRIYGSYSFAFGQGARIEKRNSVAFGYHSTSSDVDSVAIGYTSRTGSNGGHNVAIGAKAFADYIGATALGNSSTARAENAVAIGSGASATASNAVAIGANSVANGSNTVSVGSSSIKRRMVNVASGNISYGSADAVTGGQLYETNQNVASARSTADSAYSTARTARTVADTAKSNADNALSKANVLSGLLSQTSASGNVRVGASNSGTVLDVRNSANASRKITGVADATLSTTSTDAVSGKQLNATNTNVTAARSVADSAKTNADSALAKANVLSGLLSQTSASGNVRLGASNSGTVLDVRNSASASRRITGVADATLSTTSTDAVSGKQLNATNTKLADAQRVADAAAARLSASAPAIGLTAEAEGSGSTASVAMGRSAKAYNTNSIAVGADARAGVDANGDKSAATGAVALGAATRGGNGAVAAGLRASAVGDRAVAVGNDATAAATHAAALGYKADASGNQAVAIGREAAASALYSTALGNLAKAGAESAVALGDRALASHTGSVALGNGSQTTGINQVSVGSSSIKRKIVNLADGAVSSSSTEAITGKQLNETNGRVTTAQNAANGAQATANAAQVDATKALAEATVLGGLVGQVSATGIVRLGEQNRGTTLDVRNSANVNRKISGVADAILSASSAEAVSGKQLYSSNSRISVLEGVSQFLSIGVAPISEPAAAGAGGVAIGNSAKTGSESGTAVGTRARAMGRSSTAIGRGATVFEQSESGFAMGAGAEVGAAGGGADGGVAIGAGAKIGSGAHGSLALGSSAQANEAGVASFGNSGMQRRLVNIARGTADHNATTVSQLKDSLATLGGSAGMDASGNIIAPTYKVQGGTQSTVEGALMALDGAVITADRRADKVEGQLSSIFQDSPSTRADGMNQIALNGVDGMVLTNLADGRVAPGSRDAVTGSQLYAAEQKISQNRNDLEAMRKEREIGEQAMRGLDASVIDYGGARLTGVAEAKLSADSSDVVRGSQLYETNSRVSELEDVAQFVSIGSAPFSERAEAGAAGVAVGNSAKTGLEGGTAVGTFAGAMGKNSTAIGRAATVSVDSANGFAMGVGAQVGGGEGGANEGVAIGAGARVGSGAHGSLALGNGSQADEEGVASFGGVGIKRRLVNIANGTANHNAATVGQLRGALPALGGEVDASGNIVGPSFNVQGQSQSTLNGALEALDGAVVSTTSRVNQVESQLRSVFQETPSVRADGAAQLILAGANGMVISNVANGLIAAGSRDAVNGGQLHSMQQQINGRMDGLEQRIDDHPQARAMAAASTPSPSTEEIAPTPETSGSPQIASTGEGDKPAPQPKSKQDDTPKPQVDTAELEKMLARANEYTDGAISNFERRLDKMDKRFNRMAAMSSAQSAMAMNTAGLATYNRLGAGVGYSEGESAMAVGYQRVLNEKGSATFSLNGAFTNSGERSMGVGVGIGW